MQDNPSAIPPQASKEESLTHSTQKDFINYGDETQVSQYKGARIMYIVLGSIFLGLGILGVFLPVLPTTPFLLLTAGCYARGSVRFYNWLMNNRFFGSYIRDWRDNKGIPLHAKILAVSMITITIGITAIFFVPLWPVKILLVGIGASVSIYIIRKPTKPSDNTGSMG